jgi:hypothetical protein
MLNFSSAISVDLFSSPPRKLWGYGTDLSGYDLSLYLHGTPLSVSNIPEKLKLADRCPWREAFLPKNIERVKVVPGIVRTEVKPQGLYHNEPVVGLFSLMHAGYFEITFDSLGKLRRAPDVYTEQKETIIVNAREIAVSSFYEELLFWGGDKSNYPKRITFDKISEQDHAILVQRQFDEKRFQISKEIEMQITTSTIKDTSLVEKLFT